jgi:hypothetical protein
MKVIRDVPTNTYRINGITEGKMLAIIHALDEKGDSLSPVGKEVLSILCAALKE